MSASNTEPLYRQIVRRLTSDIEEGALKPHDRLPTENQLIEHFGVSRVTVRQALNELVSKGLVYKHQGRGTFVAGTESLSSSGRDQDKYLGVVVSYINAPHMGALLSGLEEEAKKHGLRMILCNSHDDPIEEARHLDELRKEKVAGIILYPTADPISRDSAEKIHRDGPPFVLVDRYYVGVDCDYVVSDNFQGAYDIVSNMLDTGYTHIAYLTDNPVYPSPRRDRFIGYQQALEAHGMFFSEKVVIVDDYGERGAALVRSALERLVDVDAVFASNVSIALLALQCANQMGLKIPQDIGIACFDGYGPAVPVGFSLTTANQRMDAIAKKAVEVCVSRIRHKPEQPQQIKIPVDIYTGNTTKVLPKGIAR